MVFDNQWQEVTDTANGSIESKQQWLTAHYVFEKPEEGHYETIAEYPNGGKDVKWVVDSEAVGRWHYLDEAGNKFEHGDIEPEPNWSTAETYRKLYEWQVYTPYTAEELAAQAKAEAEAKAEMEERRYRQELLDAVPDAVAELSEAVSDGGGEHSDYSDAIADLSQLVSDLCEAVGL